MVEYLIISLVFFFLGRYSQTIRVEEITKEAIKKAKRKLSRVPLGAIKAPTQESTRRKNDGTDDAEKRLEELS